MTNLTALMSVKNGEQYIKETIQSVLDQTYKDFFFLIIDNNSTDTTLKIIRNFKDSRIKTIELAKDIGQTNALNLGILKIKTKYFARIDADDLCLPNRFKLQMTYLLNNPKIALLGTGIELIDKNNRHLSNKIFSSEHNDIIESISIENPFAHPSVVLKTDIVKSLNLYDNSYYLFQDYALWINILSQHKAHNLQDILVRVRIHKNQISRSKESKTIKRKEYLKLLDQIEEKIPLGPAGAEALLLRKKMSKVLFLYNNKVLKNFIFITIILVNLPRIFSNFIIRSYVKEKIFRLIKGCSLGNRP